MDLELSIDDYFARAQKKMIKLTVDPLASIEESPNSPHSSSSNGSWSNDDFSVKKGKIVQGQNRRNLEKEVDIFF